MLIGLCAVIGVSRRIPRRSAKRTSIEKGGQSGPPFFVCEYCKLAGANCDLEPGKRRRLSEVWPENISTDPPVNSGARAPAVSSPAGAANEKPDQCVGSAGAKFAMLTSPANPGRVFGESQMHINANVHGCPL